jgi:non-ribosomal peptide synthetase component F
MPGLDVEVVEGIANGTAKFDLNVIAIPRAEQLGSDAGGPITLIWEYDGELFEPATIAAAAERYRRLLDAAAADPQARLSDLVARTQMVPGPEWAAPAEAGEVDEAERTAEGAS